MHPSPPVPFDVRSPIIQRTADTPLPPESPVSEPPLWVRAPSGLPPVVRPTSRGNTDTSHLSTPLRGPSGPPRYTARPDSRTSGSLFASESMSSFGMRGSVVPANPILAIQTQEDNDRTYNEVQEMDAWYSLIEWFERLVEVVITRGGSRPPTSEGTEANRPPRPLDPVGSRKESLDFAAAMVRGLEEEARGGSRPAPPDQDDHTRPVSYDTPRGKPQATLRGYTPGSSVDYGAATPVFPVPARRQMQPEYPMYPQWYPQPRYFPPPYQPQQPQEEEEEESEEESEDDEESEWDSDDDAMIPTWEVEVAESKDRLALMDEESSVFTVTCSYIQAAWRNPSHPFWKQFQKAEHTKAPATLMAHMLEMDEEARSKVLQLREEKESEREARVRAADKVAWMLLHGDNEQAVADMKKRRKVESAKRRATTLKERPWWEAMGLAPGDESEVPNLAEIKKQATDVERRLDSLPRPASQQKRDARQRAVQLRQEALRTRESDLRRRAAVLLDKEASEGGYRVDAQERERQRKVFYQKLINGTLTDEEHQQEREARARERYYRMIQKEQQLALQRSYREQEWDRQQQQQVNKSTSSLPDSEFARREAQARIASEETDVELDELQWNADATRIQAAFRGYRARVRVQQMLRNRPGMDVTSFGWRRRLRAIVRIQAWARGLQSRSLVQFFTPVWKAEKEETLRQIARVHLFKEEERRRKGLVGVTDAVRQELLYTECHERALLLTVEERIELDQREAISRRELSVLQKEAWATMLEDREYQYKLLVTGLVLNELRDEVNHMEEVETYARGEYLQDENREWSDMQKEHQPIYDRWMLSKDLMLAFQDKMGTEQTDWVDGFSAMVRYYRRAHHFVETASRERYETGRITMETREATDRTALVEEEDAGRRQLKVDRAADMQEVNDRAQFLSVREEAILQNHLQSDAAITASYQQLLHETERKRSKLRCPQFTDVTALIRAETSDRQAITRQEMVGRLPFLPYEAIVVWMVVAEKQHREELLYDERDCWSSLGKAEEEGRRFVTAVGEKTRELLGDFVPPSPLRSPPPVVPSRGDTAPGTGRVPSVLVATPDRREDEDATTIEAQSAILGASDVLDPGGGIGGGGGAPLYPMYPYQQPQAAPQPSPYVGLAIDAVTGSLVAVDTSQMGGWGYPAPQGAGYPGYPHMMDPQPMDPYANWYDSAAYQQQQGYVPEGYPPSAAYPPQDTGMGYPYGMYPPQPSDVVVNSTAGYQYAAPPVGVQYEADAAVRWATNAPFTTAASVSQPLPNGGGGVAGRPLIQRSAPPTPDERQLYRYQWVDRASSADAPVDIRPQKLRNFLRNRPVALAPL